MFTITKDNKVKYIMTEPKFYDYCYELALQEDRDKLAECIEWSESYPILQKIIKRAGYNVNTAGDIITMG